MKHISVIILLFAFGISSLRADDTHAGVVEIISTYQKYSVFEPWKKLPHSQVSGYGIVISSNLLVTTEAMVRNTTLVEFRRSRSGTKFQAVVEDASPEVNTAVLRVLDPTALEGLEQYAFTDEMKTDSEVRITQFDTTREIQTGEAKTIQTELSSLPNGGGQALEFTVQTDMNLNGNGAPVLINGKLAGMIIQQSPNDRTASILPGRMISQYVKQVQAGNFKGVAVAGFRWKLPLDPVLRNYLKLPVDEHGILLTEISPDSLKVNDLQPEDVITEWNGFDIDQLGYYVDPDYGRLLWSYLIKGHGTPGDKVPVVIYRKGKRIERSLTLLNTEDIDELIPQNLTNERSEYLIEGGLVIRELSGEYLTSYGSDWSNRITPRLAYIYMNQQMGNSIPGKRVIIISRILRNKINEGYNSFFHNIVTHVNGVAVNNMDDIFTIRERDGFITKISMQAVGTDIILDKDQLEAANKEISIGYRIPEMQYRSEEPSI